jgi:hypothetical protein
VKKVTLLREATDTQSAKPNQISSLNFKKRLMPILKTRETSSSMRNEVPVIYDAFALAKNATASPYLMARNQSPLELLKSS